MKKYGILIGRFQPIHLAHQSIINEIMHDGLKPLIFIGSSNVLNYKNPFTYIERANMIHEIYGKEVITLPLPDNENDTTWESFVYTMLCAMNVEVKKCRLYFFKKVDEFNVNDFFKKIDHKQPSYHDIYDLISATDIRRKPIEYSKYLDGRILKYLIKS